MRKLVSIAAVCIGLFSMSPAIAKTAGTLPSDDPVAGQLPSDSELAIVIGACVAATAAASVIPPVAAFIGFNCIVIGGQAWSNSAGSSGR